MPEIPGWMINQLRTLVAGWAGKWVMINPSLLNASFYNSTFSTTAKTLINLSSTFGVPANVKAVRVRLLAKDSASAATVTCWFGLSPNNTANALDIGAWPGGKTNSAFDEQDGIVSCDANGNIYYQCVASGASTMTVILEINGYYL